MKLAYLISDYPAISLTFIEREIRFLRNEGFDIRTCSINRSSFPKQLRTDREKEEIERTYYMKGQSPISIIKAIAKSAITHPYGFLRGVKAACSLAGMDLKKIFLHLAYLSEALLLLNWMKNQSLEHVHVHFANPASTVVLFAKTVAPITFSITVHGPDEFFDISGSHLKEKALQALFICCISDYAKGQLIRLLPPFHKASLYVIHQGVDPTRYSPSEVTLNQEIPRILTVARMVPMKGIPILLEAFKQIRDQGYSVLLELVGSGPILENIQQWVFQNHLTPYVIFHGSLHSNEVLEAYRRTSLFVLPSFGEGIPVTLMEAMAFEIPCIATYVGGIPELIQSGINGLLIPSGSVETLCVAIKKILQNPVEARSLGINARETVQRDYNLTNNHLQLAVLFRKKLQMEQV